MTRFTLWGLYQYDNTLFNDVVLPSGINKQRLIDDIIERSGDLFLYYQVPSRAKYQITSWFERHFVDFSQLYKALLLEYEPLENYDRKEESWRTLDTTRKNESSGQDDITRSGTDKTVLSGQDKNTHLGDNTRTNNVSAFDSTTYSPHDESIDDIDESDTTDYGRVEELTHGSSDTTTYGRTDELNGNDKEHNNLRAHGNIGVTTFEQMASGEVSLRMKYNLYDVIAIMFERDLLVQIY